MSPIFLLLLRVVPASGCMKCCEEPLPDGTCCCLTAGCPVIPLPPSCPPPPHSLVLGSDAEFGTFVQQYKKEYGSAQEREERRIIFHQNLYVTYSSVTSSSFLHDILYAVYASFSFDTVV